jgi:hypothetical protein
MVGISNDDMVENFDFQQLTCADEIVCDFNVRLGWSRLATRMVVLAPSGSGASATK